MNEPTKKTTLCVALIVKNEQKRLAGCLDSVKNWVDEIVILDSGSSDQTEMIARQYTNKFFVSDNWPGFGPQRQRAQQYITSDYVLWLDADERVTPELKKEVLSALKHNNKNTIYSVNRLSSAFGKPIHHSGWSPDWIARMHPTELTHYNDALVHESLIIPAGVEQKRFTGRLLHFTFDNLTQYTQKTSMYINSWVDQREGNKKASLWSAISHGLFRFIKMYFLKKGFLDGRHGFLLAVLSANTVFIRYADLWLRDYTKKKISKDNQS